MIFLVGASAIYLTALQASINAPRSAFQTCLREAADKAAAQKVDGDGFEAFVHTACDAKMSSFKAAVAAFDMKNRMSRKDASEDADSMIADFVSGSVNHYRFMLKTQPVDAAAKTIAADKAAPAPGKAVATPASAPVNPPPPK